MQATKRSFIPAAGYDFALPLYDPVTKLLGAGAARRVLIEEAQLQPGQRVLDLGCGTGLLMIAAQRSCPGVDLIGLDPDEKAIARAHTNARRAGITVTCRQGFADALPFADQSFDRVLSSFVFHHLDATTQERALVEITRVLKPDGRVHVLDLAHADRGVHGFLQRLVLLVGKSDVHIAADLAASMRQAGLASVRASEQPKMLFQRVVSYSAVRSGPV